MTMHCRKQLQEAIQNETSRFSRKLFDQIQSALETSMVTLDQLALLKQTEFNKNRIAMKALMLLYSYKTISDEFGFNPKADKQAIV